MRGKRTKTDYHFSKSSILSFVWRGILVGIISGTIVSLFRLIIEKLFHGVLIVYRLSHHHSIILVFIAIISIFLMIFIGLLVKSEPDIKGSGIPHVEGELKGILHPKWWSV